MKTYTSAGGAGAVAKMALWCYVDWMSSCEDHFVGIVLCARSSSWFQKKNDTAGPAITHGPATTHGPLQQHCNNTRPSATTNNTLPLVRKFYSTRYKVYRVYKTGLQARSATASLPLVRKFYGTRYQSGPYFLTRLRGEFPHCLRRWFVFLLLLCFWGYAGSACLHTKHEWGKEHYGRRHLKA